MDGYMGIHGEGTNLINGGQRGGLGEDEKIREGGRDERLGERW